MCMCSFVGAQELRGLTRAAVCMCVHVCGVCASVSLNGVPEAGGLVGRDAGARRVQRAVPTQAAPSH